MRNRFFEKKINKNVVENGTKIIKVTIIESDKVFIKVKASVNVLILSMNTTWPMVVNIWNFFVMILPFFLEMYP